MAERLETLLVWALASFHTAVLLLVVATLFQATGGLGPLLGQLRTEIGLLLYLVLWALLGAAVRQALRGVAFTTGGPDHPAAYLATQAALYGGLLGAGLLLTGGVVLAVVNGGGFSAGEALSLGIFLALGGTFAFAVGALVAVVLAALDAALLRGARWLLA